MMTRMNGGGAWNGVNMNRMDPRLNRPDNVYFDATVVNRTDEAMEAMYATTRNTPIVEKCSDYYLAVARFNIPNDSIPLFTFFDNTYEVTMTNGGVSSSRFVSYVPYSSLPGERGVYTVQHFLDMVNATIALCCADVGIVDVPLVFCNYDTQIQAIRFSDNANWRSVLPAVPVWQLSMNWRLYFYFQGISVLDRGVFVGKAFDVIVKDNGNGNVKEYPVGSGTTVYEMGQECPLLSNYISINSIIVGTTTVPINAEQISFAPQRQPFGLGDNTTFNIITDFTPGEAATFSENFTPYVYNPAFYRLVDLLSNEGLKKFDFQLYYSDIYQKVTPLVLLPGQRASVKFIFVKKALFSNEY